MLKGSPPLSMCWAGDRAVVEAQDMGKGSMDMNREPAPSSAITTRDGEACHGGLTEAVMLQLMG